VDQWRRSVEIQPGFVDDVWMAPISNTCAVQANMPARFLPSSYRVTVRRGFGPDSVLRGLVDGQSVRESRRDAAEPLHKPGLPVVGRIYGRKWPA
jgi:hypothetical protein